ncbi:hypothetical protein [Streptomyces sp. NBC_00151]|nr:hypothetical protein [Streptomyces sp. NBC_00151]WRZ41895.1 hypothetical protein OG915_29955 [Streptomyces sp. NBC_00151]
MSETTEAARTERAVPGRRLIAAGLISRRVDVRVTEAGVTGAIRKGARR